MQPYRCGCDPVAHAYCSDHYRWSCHGGPEWTNVECPRCRRLRLLSIALSPQATPTRNGDAR